MKHPIDLAARIVPKRVAKVIAQIDHVEKIDHVKASVLIAHGMATIPVKAIVLGKAIVPATMSDQIDRTKVIDAVKVIGRVKAQHG